MCEILIASILFCRGSLVLPSPRGSNPKSPGRLQDNSIAKKYQNKLKWYYVTILSGRYIYEFIHYTGSNDICMSETLYVQSAITYLPSSHGGAGLPGNQTGRSGPSGSHTVDTPPLVAFARRCCRVLADDTAAAAPGCRCGGGLGAWHARMLTLLQKIQNAQTHGGGVSVTAEACERERRGCAMFFTLAGGCMPRTSRRTAEP